MVMSGQVLESCTACLRSRAAAMRISAACRWMASDSMMGPSRIQKSAERAQCRFGHVVLDAFGIGFGGFRRHPERDQDVDHEPVTGSYARGKLLSSSGQEDPAIGTRRRQPLALEPRDRL